MPRYIAKIEHEGQAYYMEWSTVVDAPVTYGMPLDEFTEHYREKYGTEGLRDLPERLERVEKYGTSQQHRHEDARELMSCNRAGKGETCLTYEQIIEAYCVNRMEEAPVGTPTWEEEDTPRE